MKHLGAFLFLGVLAALSMGAETSKSKSQVSREKNWEDKVKTRKLASGEPLHTLAFGGLTMGSIKAEAQKFMLGGPGKVAPEKDPVSLYDKEVMSYVGHPKLNKVRSTELAFFKDRLMRISVRFETPDANLTFAAMTALLEGKYGEFPAKEKEKGARTLTIEKDSIVLTLSIQRGPKGDEVAVVMRDREMEEAEWETSVEKEKASLGEL